MAERKKYIEVNIPLLDSSLKVLGTPENLHDKTIKLDLTRKMRGKGLTITFRILKEGEKELSTVPNKMDLSKTYIRRMIRKRTDYVEDSFEAKCADVMVTIKPFLITRKRVSRAVRRNLRNTCKEFLVEYIKDKYYLDICNELIDGILQKAMLPRLKKIYPLSFCDLRIFETNEISKIDLSKQRKEKKEEKVQEPVQGEQEKSEETKEVKVEEVKAEESEETPKKEKKAKKKKEEKSEEKKE